MDAKALILSRRARFLAAAIAATGIAFLDRPARSDEPKPPPDEQTRQMAEEHFKRGEAMANEAECEMARFELERSQALVPHPKKVRLIAYCDEVLQNWSQAYERYVELGDRERAEAARARCGDIDVTAIPPQAEIRVDDDVRQPRDGKIVLTPGRRKISVSMHGGMTTSRVVVVAAGEHLTLADDATPRPCLEPLPHASRGCHCDVPGR